MNKNGYLVYANPKAKELLDILNNGSRKKLIEVIPDYEIDDIFKKTLENHTKNKISLNFWGKEKKYLEIESFYLKKNEEVMLIVTDNTPLQKMEENFKEFLGNASHELRTPLTSVQILIDLFSEKKITLDEIYNEFFPYLRKEIERMGKLVSNLLNLSRLEAGVIELQLKEIKLVEAVINVVERLNPYISKKKLKIKVKIPDDLVIEADPQHLDTILFNLIENAVKYTFDGGKVEVSIKKNKESISIFVKDTGVGIPEKDLNRIFDRFYRISKSRTNEDGFSTGLGLSIVKKLVERHGWDIKVESKLNEGTKFEIILPKRKEG
ncbi:MAG TPA: HAMP domain-containing sensor histidine kinase [Dictyoglomaceae bacterium]|nr:HAMP domain-containing sensor histidine kinase [Dictyoglomaceae bacterium]HOL38850.1 HAMP domain-containing sensor histidine kinase [Dictyoglomaceae bacterium]HOP95377.1 HAMP domain-containing sensor histidine kinase [Dictyoglomaceae bacterium]HPP15733.1 HAMP domain-containing sensor histidine kinase [Dictyoglomaceae bacterium]HPU43703.1 HAMP domain-containing sensor histidine kinase [Dictyoglomaceae bacterium]